MEVRTLASYRRYLRVSRNGCTCMSVKRRLSVAQGGRSRLFCFQWFAKVEGKGIAGFTEVGLLIYTLSSLKRDYSGVGYKRNHAEAMTD